MGAAVGRRSGTLPLTTMSILGDHERHQESNDSQSQRQFRCMVMASMNQSCRLPLTGAFPELFFDYIESEPAHYCDPEAASSVPLNGR